MMSSAADKSGRSATPGRPVAAAAPSTGLLGGRTAWVVLTVGQLAAVVAVLQRSSLGVAAADALGRFGITAATLGLFSMVQLLVYAALQVPVGVLIDRYGSKRLVIIGALLMASAQALFAVADSLPLAFTARVVLGVGDALIFISIMRLIPAWFPPHRSGQITNATGQLYQLGFLVSAVGFGAVLGTTGWTPAFLTAAGLSVVTGALVLAVLKDSPRGRPPPGPLGHALAVAGHNIREAWAEAGTRLGFWVSFATVFAPMVFGVMWGYPFLTIGLDLSTGTARGLMGALAVAAIVQGPVLGRVVSRHPYHRSLIAVVIVGVTAVVWTAVLLWPGRAPLALLVALVVVLPANSVAGVMAFDFARIFNRASRLGSAIGVVNVGGFGATLIAVVAIGVVLQALTPAGSVDYSLAAFKWAFATQYVLWALGVVQVLRYRRRAQRQVAARDPEAFAALRRGVNLSPPT